MSKRPWDTVSAETLIELFSNLAVMLSPKAVKDMPAWMSLPGRQWPIYQPLIEIAKTDMYHPWVDLLEMISKLSSSTLESRWQSFEKLMVGKNGSQLCLHESKYRQGRILGPITFQVRALYEQVGLRVIGAELADHVSLELDFMIYLFQEIKKNDSGIETWVKARDLFYEKHLQDWMPSLGREFNSSSDPAWKIVGHLLIALFENEQSININTDRKYPSISDKEKCSLCGFCIQVCPTNALQMMEDERTSSLWMKKDQCIHCNKCVKICPEKAINLNEILPENPEIILRESPRAKCSSCQQATISQAELDFTSEKLGHPKWLTLCLECRSISLENIL